MFKSVISKFAFFFWFFFLIVTIPIYIFTNVQLKDIIKNSEEEKLTLTLNTLKPIISIHLYLDQEKQLHELLNNLFENIDVYSVKLISSKGEILYDRKRGTINKNKLIKYEYDILDSVNQKKIAQIYLLYSNEHLFIFNNKIHAVLLYTFIFSLFIFMMLFWYIKYDLIALRNIAESLRLYSSTKEIKKINQASKSHEISTIANVANEMLVSIAEYVKQLKSFNVELEKRVKEESSKLQNQERMMIHQSRQAAMGEMLESIAHQWRQPLNIIGLATANLETEYDLGLISDKNFHDKMEVISLNINYMSDTIDDFRDFLNPKKSLTDFDVKKSIEDVLTILRAQLNNYKIKCELDVNAQLIFHGSDNEFKQVMLILLNNSKDAIKLLQQDKELNGEISITLSEENGYGMVKVCDNGGGVCQNIIDNIFNPYFSTKQNSNGTGIGLYIAKSIIETRMNGNIGVRNTQDGCCFTISIPL